MKMFMSLLIILVATSALAGEADVVDAKAKKIDAGGYRFDVTIEHADTGWDHYANKWDVVGPDGQILGTRILHHPHVNEQPFTRSLSAARVPEGVEKVTIRGHDSVHGYGGKTFSITLPRQLNWSPTKTPGPG